MNFRDLTYIAAVAEYSNFHKAAKSCHVSQPALSMQIKKLEGELGVTLFERYKKTLHMTAQGRLIINKAREILQLRQEFYQLVASGSDPFAASLKIGVFPTLAQYFIPALLKTVREWHPRLTLIPIEEKSEVLLSRLDNGEIDVALLALPLNNPHLHWQKLFEDRFVVAVYPGHPLADCQSVSLQTIQSEHMLILEEGHCLRDQIVTLDNNLTFSYTATSLETLRQMVQAGLGITIMPEIATLKQNCPGDELVYIHLEAPDPCRSIALVHRPSSPFSAVMKSLETLVPQAYESLLATSAGAGP